jgi:hypothetical protein
LSPLKEILPPSHGASAFYTPIADIALQPGTPLVYERKMHELAIESPIYLNRNPGGYCATRIGNL